MITNRTALALALLASPALCACLTVRHPLAESDASVAGTGADADGDERGSHGGNGAAGMWTPPPDGTQGGSGGFESWAGMTSAGFGGEQAPPPDSSMGGSWSDPTPEEPDVSVGGAGGGWAMGGAPWGASGGAGGDVCGCDDGDPCTIELCNGDGTCTHEPFGTMVDQDGDGYSEGCDCDDSTSQVSFNQTDFFAEPRNLEHSGGPAYDYDCDGQHTLMLTSEARACELYEGLDVCFGDGWLLSAGQPIPECGAGGSYQVCEFRDGACVRTVVMMLQRCR